MFAVDGLMSATGEPRRTLLATDPERFSFTLQCVACNWSNFPDSRPCFRRTRSLIRGLGNSACKRLNFHYEYERQLSCPAQIRRISLYFPTKQGIIGWRQVPRCFREIGDAGRCEGAALVLVFVRRNRDERVDFVIIEPTHCRLSAGTVHVGVPYQT